MVPELLSEDLCSLHPHSDRLAFSVLLQMDEEATVLSSRFEKTVIRSSGALSYKQAQARIDDADSVDPLTKTIQTLNRLAGKLRQRRMREGAAATPQPVPLPLSPHRRLPPTANGPT
eukprot:scaffold33336_cov73-Isochrysis_galbana.AAC.1